MVVRYIKNKLNKSKLTVEITFAVDYATWNAMSRSSAAAQHPDTLDYIAGRLNAAFIDDDGTPASNQADNKCISREIDDDIPF